MARPSVTGQLPALFLRQVIAELRKVIWPTRRELRTYTIVALVFVLVMVVDRDQPGLRVHQAGVLGLRLSPPMARPRAIGMPRPGGLAPGKLFLALPAKYSRGAGAPGELLAPVPPARAERRAIVSESRVHVT